MPTDLLLKHGADLEAVANDGHTPLSTALLFLGNATAQHLLELGAGLSRVKPGTAIPVLGTRRVTNKISRQVQIDVLEEGAMKT